MQIRDRHARELRAVAPLLADGSFVGPVVLVQHAGRTLGATDVELLRPYVGAQLEVVTRLDGSERAPVDNWGVGRHTGLGLLELAAPIAPGGDVRPVELGAVCGSVDPKGAPTALVGIVREGERFARSIIPVQLDRDDGGGMSDSTAQLASPHAEEHVGLAIEGAALFVWFPASPALGRASEVAVLGLAQAYRGFAKPREHPVLAEIVGLDDIGRALIAALRREEREPELSQIAGEIEAAPARSSQPR